MKATAPPVVSITGSSTADAHIVIERTGDQLFAQNILPDHQHHAELPTVWAKVINAKIQGG
jgi:hypothetical protein